MGSSSRVVKVALEAVIVDCRGERRAGDDQNINCKHRESLHRNSSTNRKAGPSVGQKRDECSIKLNIRRLFVDRLGRRWVRVRTRVFFANWLADPTPCKAYVGLDCDPHRLPQLPRHRHHHIFAERRKTGNRPPEAEGFPYSEHFAMSLTAFRNAKDPTEVRA